MLIRAKRNRIPILLTRTGYIAHPLPEPQQPTNDQRPECDGCPYPRHGMSCSGPDGCLYLDMQQIEQRSKKNKGG